MTTSPIQRNKSGSILKSGERRIIYNVFKYFKQHNSKEKVVDIVFKTAIACGVSENTVYRIMREQKGKQKGLNTGIILKPVGKRVRLSIVDTLTEQTKSAIREKVQEIYANNENPTLNKIMKLCEADDDIPTFKRTTLQKVLRVLGYDFNKKDDNTMLLYRQKIKAEEEIEIKENPLVIDCGSSQEPTTQTEPKPIQRKRKISKPQPEEIFVERPSTSTGYPKQEYTLNGYTITYSHSDLPPIKKESLPQPTTSRGRKKKNTAAENSAAENSVAETNSGVNDPTGAVTDINLLVGDSLISIEF